MTAWRPTSTRSPSACGAGAAYEAASATWERAAELTVDAVTRARQLQDAAMSAWLGGQTGRAHILAEDARN
jgi:hypothetical protein